MIIEALAAMKEPNGSEIGAICSFIEVCGFCFFFFMLIGERSIHDIFSFCLEEMKEKFTCVEEFFIQAVHVCHSWNLRFYMMIPHSMSELS